MNYYENDRAFCETLLTGDNLCQNRTKTHMAVQKF